MEMDVAEAARRDGFLATKKNTDYTSERVIMKGTFCCHKSGGTKIVGGRTNKTNCLFKLHFRRQTATGVCAFRPNPQLTHNHDLDPASAMMSAMARGFTPKQLTEINNMRSNGVSVAQITSELRRRTNSVVTKRDVYNALGRTGRTHYDGLSQTQALLSAPEGNGLK